MSFLGSSPLWAGIPILESWEYKSVFDGTESVHTASKLSRILNFVELRNLPTKTSTLSRVPTGSGPFSVSVFNIEQGRRLKEIRTLARRVAKGERVGLDQVDQLFGADVILINEADWGTCRSGFQNVAAQLSEDLNYDFAFGTEFLEVQPERVGLVQGRGTKDCQRPEFVRGAPQVTGNAVLSRFPIRSVKRVSLPRCHDWFRDQKEARFLLEERQTRRGDRMALVARVDLPGGGPEDLTVVSVHLENKAWPDCRRDQMKALMSELGSETLPVVIGGDLNVWGGITELGTYFAAKDAGYSWSANDGQPTFRTAGMQLRLDYLLYQSRTLENVERRTLHRVNIPHPLSDHDPVFGVFQIK